MGEDFSRPPWAEAIIGVWRAGWPVLLPTIGAIVPAALGASPGAGNGVAVAIVVAGSALLPPRRFAALCWTTLALGLGSWSQTGGGALLVALLADAAISVPFVIAGRAVFVLRRRARAVRVAGDSRLAVTRRAALRKPQLDSSRSS